MVRNNFTSLMLLLTIGLVLSLSSCDPSKKYVKDENESIQKYLSHNPDLNYVLKPSGLYYLEIQPGTGPLPVTNDTAYVIYTGFYLNGKIFDSNVGLDTLIFPVGSVWIVPGLDEGVTYMKRGGKSEILVPSVLAYGPGGSYPIPGYTALLFDIELVRLKAGPGK